MDRSITDYRGIRRIRYNNRSWGRNYRYCCHKGKMLLSNLLKPLLVFRGLFKSGMSSLTVRVVVDEDEFISTKQTPAPVGESIKINHIIRRLRPLHCGTRAQSTCEQSSRQSNTQTVFVLGDRMYSVAAAAVVLSTKICTGGGNGTKSRNDKIRKTSRKHVNYDSMYTGKRMLSSRQQVLAHVDEYFHLFLFHA